jgi:hypothetical protein
MFAATLYFIADEDNRCHYTELETKVINTTYLQVSIFLLLNFYIYSSVKVQFLIRQGTEINILDLVSCENGLSFSLIDVLSVL